MVLSSILAAAQTVPAVPTSWDIFSSELLGTFLLIAVGTAVTAANFLPKSKAFGSGWVVVTFGWGFAVFVGVYGAWKTGGHLNPVVTLSKVIAHGFDPDVTLNGLALGSGGVAVTAMNVFLYIAAQFLGAFVGAVVAWVALRQHYDEPTSPEVKLGTFATGPAIRNSWWNFLTEVVATGILVLWVTVSGGTPTQIGPLAVALVIVVIGMGLGGPTGYALNPARDFSPRLAHALLPFKGKGSSDWSYAWIPFAGPIVGSVIGTVIGYGMGMGV